jgi:Fe-S-cluster-containing dehydrogenase component
MKQKYIVFDVEKCVGCYNCLMACKDEHVGNTWLPFTDEQQKHGERWINPVRHERGQAPIIDQCFVTELCNHCEDAPCAKAHPDCVKRRADGIVLLDPEKAKGNRALAESCPYGRISWNEERECAQKCTMCAHLLDKGWAEPRCVQACPLRALSMDVCEPEKFKLRIREENLESLDGAGGLVWYKNLYRRKAAFIAGAVAFNQKGLETCAAGCTVSLCKGSIKLKECKTDFFGEFKFDYLPPNSGEYKVECVMDGHNPITATVNLTDSTYIGVLKFAP